MLFAVVQKFFIMTDQNERDYPTVYEVDGDVDLSLYGDFPTDRNPFARPNVGYGSSFTSRDDLTTWFIEWFEEREETELFVNHLINKNLIQYESSVSGFVINYRLYDQSDFWLECIEAFTAEKDSN